MKERYCHNYDEITRCSLLHCCKLDCKRGIFKNKKIVGKIESF